MTAIQANTISKFVPHTPSSNFSIHFEENLSETELLKKITTIPQAQVVMWYIGSHGFKEDGITFYKDKLNHLLNSSNTSMCWLMDLTAWGAFHNPHNKIITSSRCLEQITNFNIHKLSCISAATLFQRMGEIQDQTTIDYVKSHVLTRKDLLDKSENSKEVGIKVGKIFNEKCPIFEELYELDASKTYSVVQYVEGYMIIDQIVRINLNGSTDINIIFALPNDESKYYYDDNHHFIQDIEVLLNAKYQQELKSKNINIYFFNFKYGDKLNYRPYNSGKKIVKTITKEMLL